MEMIDFTLPNGQVIKIPADTSDEKKQEIIENITTNSNVKAEEAKQSEETGAKQTAAVTEKMENTDLKILLNDTS